MGQLLYNEDTYKLIGLCMDVHRELGKGFSEVVYGDALEIECINNTVCYSRETAFNIIYKGNLLPHKYKADFIIDTSAAGTAVIFVIIMIAPSAT